MNPTTSQNLIIQDTLDLAFPIFETKPVVLASKENIKKWTKAQSWQEALNRTFGDYASHFYTKKIGPSLSAYVVPQVHKITHTNCNEAALSPDDEYKPESLDTCQNCRQKITPSQLSRHDYEYYPFAFNEKAPNRIYLYDDMKKTIWVKCLVITIASPLYILAKTIENLHKATIGNATTYIKQCKGLPTPYTSKKDRWWHPIADLIRTPIYTTITAIVALSAVIIGAVAPSTLHSFRQLIGRIDRRHSWDQDDHEKNFVPCFHDHDIRKLVKNHILRHIEVYSTNHDFTEMTSDPEKTDNLLWYTLNSLAHHQITKIKGITNHPADAEQERSCLKALITADPHAPYMSPLLKG